MFVNRQKELNALEKRYNSGKPELIVIYGRRRVGKTELIKRFVNDKKGIILLAREEAEKPQLKRFSKIIAKYQNDEFLTKNPIQSWDGFFTYIAKLCSERFIIAIDEFPYLISENKTIPSLLQDHWDTTLNKTKLFLILCGSSVSILEKRVLSHKSPLYGRRTGQLLIPPFKFKDVLRYLEKELKTSIEAYSVFGGTPTYLLEFNKNISVMKNIENSILRWDSYLFKDVEFLLRAELTEPRYYFSILSAISKGNTKPFHIMNETGLAKGVVGKYLSVLSDLHLVERRVPVTENPLKSRKGLYFLKDNFFNFWFRFVYPNTEEIEDGKQKNLIKEHIQPTFDQYVSKIFEDVCRQALANQNTQNTRNIQNYTKVGSWWYKEKEIDVVGLNERKNEMLFGECKWKDNVDPARIISSLRRKAEAVEWKNNIRHEMFAVFARSFKRKVHDKDVMLLDSKAIECMF